MNGIVDSSPLLVEVRALELLHNLSHPIPKKEALAS